MRYSETERIYDELLLTRIQAGDRRAGERLAARWHPKLMRTAYRLLRDQEQERVAVQEAWTGICKGWLGLRRPSRFPAWAYRILHNKCADQIRANQRDREYALAEAELTTPPRGEDIVSVDQAFGQLTGEHRAAATLYFSEGLTLAEIAEVTSVPVGTAKSRIFHARKQLQAALSDQPETEGE